MPLTFGSLPGDLLFFTFGIVAKRNGWLDDTEQIEQHSQQHSKNVSGGWISGWYRFVAYGTTVFFGGLTIGSLWYVDVTYKDGLGMLKTNLPYDPSTYNCTTANIHGGNNKTPVGTVVLLLSLLSLWLGVFLMFVSVSCIDVFKRGCNGTPSSLWVFLAKHAYAVYLLHSFVVVFVTDLWIVVLNGTGVNPLFPFG